jgi:Ser/Thr protein kinase RdoA (MazF antagonist)
MRTALSTSTVRNIDWLTLDARGPRLPVDAVSEAIRERYALHGRLVRLACERDDVYRLDLPSGPPRIVRVSPATEPAESLALQNAALHAIARRDPTMPVPRIVASNVGSDVETIEYSEGRYRLRVLSFLEGAPVFLTPRSVSMLRSIGMTLARLDVALQGVSAGERDFPLLWDVRRAPQLRPLVRFIADARSRAAVDRVLAELESEGLARLGNLPAQVIHNDFNPKNILFDPTNVHVVGVIDFGDVVHAARIVDLGVTVARHLEVENPMRAPPQIIAGYGEVAPVSHDELQVIPLVVRARLAMRAVIGSWRMSQQDSRGDPAQIESALTLLDLISGVRAEVATQQWGAIAGA